MADGTTRFALWAPDARSVTLLLWSGDTLAMQPVGDGWYEATHACGNGMDYRFVINGEVQVPDPAARAQVDEPWGWSRVVNHSSYEWKTTGWSGRPWHETVIYELHVGLLGGFEGVRNQLAALAELGVTAIELMPLAEFPGARNWGYDGVLPFAPEASYGTPEQLKALVDTAHEFGLMVFVDVVYNHFGPEGNYLNQYAKRFFREDIQTPWGSAIDFRRQEVRDFFCENALMWVLDYRIDGLRFDAVHAISERDFLVELAMRVRAALAPGRHVHLMLENEANEAELLQQGFDAQWNDDGHNVLHHLLTGEQQGYYAGFADGPTVKLARFLGEGFIYQGEQDRQGRQRGTPSAHLPPTSFILFLQNHDQVGNRALGERLTQLADSDALTAATGLLLLAPMVPLLFMGEEWGSQVPFLYFTEHSPELARLVCEGRRNEFAAFDHFRDAQLREQIPDPNASSTFTASLPGFATPRSPEQQARQGLYRQLLRIRTTEIVPRLHGAYSAGVTILAEGAVSAFWRLGDERLLRIDLNLGGAPAELKAPWEQVRILYNHRVDEASLAQGALPPRSVLVTLDKGV
ncbi:MAG TPA: malto-oligosyltrehalose trehalohydrolase [Cellvibrio sp.]|nr:malto-oligosyltrehalose trehalohydrolase [Cellvibrio sp.]